MWWRLSEGPALVHLRATLAGTALQDLEPQQLLLFVQSFGIPVSSMSKLLQYLDQAVAQDPQTLEQNIMDKSKSWGHEAGSTLWPTKPFRADCTVVLSGGHLPLWQTVEL